MSDDPSSGLTHSDAAAAADADSHESSAERLESEGKSADASVAWYKAGSIHLAESRFERATAALARVRSLDPSHQAACWSLADAWLLRSYISEAPYADRAALTQALSAWDAGVALGWPSQADSWTYITRALINEQEGRLTAARRSDMWWGAIVFLERSILLDATDARRWAYLGRFYRFLEHESCAVHATAQAMERDPEDSVSLEERAAILADVVATDETIDLLDHRLKQDPENAWARSVKAFALMRQRKYSPALAIIEGVVTADPENLWNLDVRALCQAMLRDVASARASYEQIWALRTTVPADSSDDLRICANAGFKLGYIDEATNILRPLAAEPSEQALTLQLLGMCAFAKGDLVDAERLLLKSFARAGTRAIEDFLFVDLPDLEAIAPRLSNPAGATETFMSLRRAAAARLADLNRNAPTDTAVAAMRELTDTLTAAASTVGSWAATAASSGLARVELAEGRWRAAAVAYARLGEADGRFPEASLAVDRAIEGLHSEARNQVDQVAPGEASRCYQELLELAKLMGRRDLIPSVHEELGELLWRLGQPGDAREHFERALSTDSPALGEQRRADFLSRLALAQQQTGDRARALQGFTEALQRYHALELPPGETLASTCRLLIRNAAEYWRVDAEWQQFARDASLTDDMRKWFTEARRSILDYLSDAYGLTPSTDQATVIPVVTPISVEVGSGLLPYVDPALDGGKFIYEDIAAMRARVERSVGFAVPGVRVRGSGVEGGAYTVLIDEVPVARGTTVPGLRFVPLTPAELAGLGISGEGVVAGGLEGDDRASWCAPSHWPALDALNVPGLTGTAFILAQVEAEIRRHLAAFLGVQEVQVLLDKLEKAGTHAAFFGWIKTIPAGSLRFARVLRVLARDQVSVGALSEFAAAVQEIGLDDLDAAVDRIRLLVKRALPGNDLSAKAVRIDPLLEERLKGLIETGGTPASASVAYACVVELRAWLESFTEPVTVVAGSASTRRIVRRLLEFEFPDVPILSLDEVYSPPAMAPIDLRVPGGA